MSVILGMKPGTQATIEGKYAGARVLITPRSTGWRKAGEG